MSDTTFKAVNARMKSIDPIVTFSARQDLISLVVTPNEVRPGTPLSAAALILLKEFR
jgi:hypothetical protein